MTNSWKLDEIWITEDEEGHFQLFLRTLKRSVIKAPIRRFLDGKQILDFLDQNAEFYEFGRKEVILFLDLNLPKIRGVDVLRCVRSATSTNRCQLPIIAMTSSCDPEDRVACFQLGCNGFLEKPINVDQLQHAIQLALKPSVVVIT